MESFEKVKWMQLPRNIVIGSNVLVEIGTVCKHLGVGKEATIVTGAHYTRKIAGEKAYEVLSDAGYEAQLVEVQAINRESIEQVKAEAIGAKFILSVGGGTVIDTGKIASFEMDIPFISAPTIASHDGIASSRASIKDPEGVLSQLKKLDEELLKKIEEIREEYRVKYNFTKYEIDPKLREFEEWLK
ncbi:MAG: Glycerol-1-phosphate dehydrogenase [NAD(P)+] [Candidatus Methanophagaceae archaeon]|nr:MAG: Glycerol-1-phosphate dehydrogenase [NAD(P)+] [Methanophagales archaeon]